MFATLLVPCWDLFGTLLIYFWYISWGDMPGAARLLFPPEQLVHSHLPVAMVLVEKVAQLHSVILAIHPTKEPTDRAISDTPP